LTIFRHLNINFLVSGKYLSVIIPVYNEEKNLEILYKELKPVLESIGKKYEIIFVDDGSSDNSLNILRQFVRSDSTIKIIKLLSNFGQSAAIAAGLENAEGENIITMDADLQHDPKDIPKLLKKLEDGYHVVCGWRKNRSKSDSLFKKAIPSCIFNFLIVHLFKLNGLHDVVGGMRAFKKEVAQEIQIYGEMHRFLPVLAAWKGFKITEEAIHIRKRHHGNSKYGASRFIRGFLDLLTVKYLISYFKRPLHIFGTIGLLLSGTGFLIDVYLLIEKFFFHVHLAVEHLPLLLLSILLIIVGVNFLFLGFIADMISLNLILTKKPKLYMIEKIETARTISQKEL